MATEQATATHPNASIEPVLGLVSDAELAAEARLAIDAAILDADRRGSPWAPALRVMRAMGMTDAEIIDEMCRVTQGERRR